MILIDKEMPTYCDNCTLFKEVGCKIPLEISGEYCGLLRELRVDHCPLKEVVRCKDCKHNAKNSGTCDHVCIEADDNWFCADGEKVTE